MQQTQPRPDVRRRRWLAPLLLFLMAALLGPAWWIATAPPPLVTIRPWRDTTGALVVPPDAVRTAPHQTDIAHVFIIREGVARRTEVSLGAIRPDSVEIRAGLTESALIAANPPRGLADRHRVGPSP